MAQEKTVERAAANPGANSADQMGAGSAGVLRAPAAVYGANRQELCPCLSLLSARADVIGLTQLRTHVLPNTLPACDTQRDENSCAANLCFQTYLPKPKDFPTWKKGCWDSENSPRVGWKVMQEDNSYSKCHQD